MKKVYLAASFKNLELLNSVCVQFERADIPVSMSKPGDPKGIRGCLERIDAADILYVLNPEGAVGKSISLDIGYALARGHEIFSMETIQDPPVSGLVGAAVSPEALISMLASRRF